MSLIRQVWLLLLVTLLLALAGSATLHVLSTRNTLQTQLRLKNSDNAAALALALSQQKGDQQLMGLLMSAQFDTGFYRSIRFVGADGTVLFKREGEGQPQVAPAWFVRAVPIESTPGTAQVSDGWRALGAVTVVSHTSFAHDDLWNGSLDSVALTAFLGLLAGTVAAMVVRGIRRPLDSTVQQAQALVDGRFITVAEPRAPELQRLTRAMNTMVQRLKSLFEAQAAQVESLRHQAHADPLTGLSNRTHFMAQLSASLQREDGPAQGGLVLLRVLDLAQVNRLIGHAATDRILAAVAQAMAVYTQRASGCVAGRLNGSDFALAMPVGGIALETGNAIAIALRATLPALGSGVAVALSAVEVRRDRDLPQLLSAADAALARAESQGPFSVEHVAAGDEGDGAAKPRGEATWRQQIAGALDEQRVKLIAFPMIDASLQLIHLDCPLRMQLEPEGAFVAAARWMPLALRSHLTTLIDERAVELALKAIERDSRPRCVNLAPASLSDSAFIARLRTTLQAQRSAARLLWLDVPEVAAVDRFAQLQELAHQLRSAGARVGLEHAGERLGRIRRLLDAGIDYVKLDGSVVRGVADDENRANHLRSAISMLHGLSMQAYAEGVESPADAQRLWQLGIDGITGPWASSQRADLMD
jgi:diguanylate cyclase (GGDEF)-like protein